MSPTAPRFPGSGSGSRGHYDREYAAMIPIPQDGQASTNSHVTGPKLLASSRPDLAPTSEATHLCFERSCRKKVRNSVGMYCDKHACHVLMTAGPFCPSISMPGSRFCAMHTNCHYKTCKYPRVNGEVNQNLPFCEHHSCTERGCPKLRAPGISVCHDHSLVCASEDCSKKTARGFFCSQHICIIMGCLEQRTHHDWCYTHSRCENAYCVNDRTRSSIYCIDHAYYYCQSVSCRAQVSPHDQFCVAHECSQDECRAPRVFVEGKPSPFCLEHTCSADGCRLATDWAGSSFCRKHRCAEIACPVSVRDQASGFCIAHNCTSALCAAPRIPGAEFCSAHGMVTDVRRSPAGRSLSRERIVKYRKEQERREMLVRAQGQEQRRLQDFAKHSKESSRELHLDTVIYPSPPAPSQTHNVGTDYRHERYIPGVSYSPSHGQNKGKGKVVEQTRQSRKMGTDRGHAGRVDSTSSNFLLPSKAYVPEPAKSPARSGCSGPSSASRSPASAASKTSPASTSRTSPSNGSSSKTSPQPLKSFAQRVYPAPLNTRSDANASGPVIHSPIPTRRTPAAILQETFYIEEDSDEEDGSSASVPVPVPATATATARSRSHTRQPGNGSASSSNDSVSTSKYSGSEHEAIAVNMTPSVGPLASRAPSPSGSLPSKLDCSSFIARLVHMANGSQVSTNTTNSSIYAVAATKQARRAVPRH